MEEIRFPIYRKYPHNRTFFKITAKDEFEELQLIGKHFSIHQIKAKILPDRNFIYDLIYDFKNNWEEISEADYNEMIAFCEKNFKRI